MLFTAHVCLEMCVHPVCGPVFLCRHESVILDLLGNVLQIKERAVKAKTYHLTLQYITLQSYLAL